MNNNHGKKSFFTMILVIFGILMILPFVLSLIISLIVAFFPIIILGLFGFLIFVLIKLLRR